VKTVNSKVDRSNSTVPIAGNFGKEAVILTLTFSIDENGNYQSNRTSS
jgi:hypothetical protein